MNYKNAYEEMKRLYDNLQQERDKYKSIVERAIKKINTINFAVSGIGPTLYIRLKNVSQGKELLKILKELEEGDSNE